MNERTFEEPDKRLRWLARSLYGPRGHLHDQTQGFTEYSTRMLGDMGDNPVYDLVGSERDVLLAYLNKMRNAVVRTSEGLTAEQQRSPGVPSGTNLLGLIQHLTGVEQHWFQRVFLGEDRETNDSMDVPVGMTGDKIVAAYREACAQSDEIVRACPDLSTLAQVVNPGEDKRDSLRSIVAHMIEETARHAGHADILREQIDGATGL
ncbi:MAG: DinB family protein [Acidimicrobiia bacterium]